MNQQNTQTIVITGASRGIGAATAEHLADRGYFVVLAARDDARLAKIVAAIRQRNGQALAVPTDVRDARQVKALMEAAQNIGGRLDGLINNAGVIDPIIHVGASDPEKWGAVVDVNLKGVYHGLRYALPVMEKNGTGTVINISSGAATSALEGWSHYCATKAALLSLTRVADKEYRDKGIRVVGLSPGTVATDMQTAIRRSGINPVSRLSPDAHIPPQWVARAIAYLLGPGADNFLGTDFSLKTPEGRKAAGLPDCS